MVIVDTSIWIEFLKGHEPYVSQFSRILQKNEILTLGPIFGELLQGARNNAERAVIMDFWRVLPKVSEEGLFVRAGFESGTGKWMDKGVGLIDSAIITAARESVAFIWSCDVKLLRLLRQEEVFTPDLEYPVPTG